MKDKIIFFALLLTVCLRETQSINNKQIILKDNSIKTKRIANDPIASEFFLSIFSFNLIFN